MIDICAKGELIKANLENLMLKKELIELLSGFPDEADVLIELNPGGKDYQINKFKPLYGCLDTSKDTSKAGNATHVMLFEEVDADRDEIFREQVRLGLPEEFFDLCDEFSTTPTDVLHQFIADLCELHNYVNNPRADGLSSRGSDERMLANQYFERTWFRD